MNKNNELSIENCKDCSVKKVNVIRSQLSYNKDHLIDQCSNKRGRKKNKIDNSNAENKNERKRLKRNYKY